MVNSQSMKNSWVYIFEDLWNFVTLCSDVIMFSFRGEQATTKSTKI